MTREEIREGIAREVYAFHPYVTAKGGLSGICKVGWDEVKDKERHYATVDNILNYLHSQGVVIKVERELPEYIGGRTRFDHYCKALAGEVQEDMFKAGYVVVESLIEGDV